jgi:hypothetical protein
VLVAGLVVVAGALMLWSQQRVPSPEAAAVESTSFRQEASDTLALVSTASSEFRLALPLEEAFWAYREAIARMGWEVESIEPRRLVTGRAWWGFARDKAKIEVLLSEAGPEAATIVLNGRIWGFGRGSTRQLNGEMNRLRNAAEVAAHRSSNPS